MMIYIKGEDKNTFSSVDKTSPPKKSSPMCSANDVSLSSKGGNPHVLTYKSCKSYEI